jgi:hypothetical protein
MMIITGDSCLAGLRSSEEWKPVNSRRLDTTEDWVIEGMEERRLSTASSRHLVGVSDCVTVIETCSFSCIAFVKLVSETRYYNGSVGGM